jgi:hypothetical protein
MSGKAGKSGRKKKIIKKVQLCTSVEPEMFSRIEKIAEDHRWTISGAINYLAELGLQKYEKKETA